MPEDAHEPLWRARNGIVLTGFALIAAFYPVTENTAHVFGVLPGLVILACPLMHLFMHHGHHGRHHGKMPQPARPDPAQRRVPCPTKHKPTAGGRSSS
jgi:hypothetical protein